MSQEHRRELIRRNLGIRPINHGQIHTCQIALAEPEKVLISPERRQTLESSLLQHQSNLIPLIVRRTEAYGEDTEYEVIYGADWFLVAQELEVEMLWAWVFDVDNEQANVTRAEAEQLTVSIAPPPQSVEQIELLLKRFEASINRSIESKLDQKIASPIKESERNIESESGEKFDSLLKQIEDTISRKIEATLKHQLSNLTREIEDKLDTKLQQQIELIKNELKKPTSSRRTKLPDYLSLTKEQLKELTTSKLKQYTKPQLQEIAKNHGLQVDLNLNKDPLIAFIQASI